MPFALDGNPTPEEISEAINYLLSNISSGVSADSYPVSNNPDTGFVSNITGTILQYEYRYLDIKYADSAAGLNFSDNPQSRLYFGLRNSNTSTESTNPADYTWFQVTGGFGLTKVLWIAVTGGRHVAYAVSQEAPDANQNWQIAPVQAVDLDNPFARYAQYMNVRYADDSIGSNISTSPTNKKFYGIYTSNDGVASTDPTAYSWSPYDFGTTYALYYRSFGGRNIAFQESTFQPAGYIPVTTAAINLDVSTVGAVSSIGIISQSPLTIQAPYRYLIVRYAEDSSGTGITTNPTGLMYFGLQASDVLAIDNNPEDFQWFYAGAEFINEIELWARTSANNIVQFNYSLAAPDNSGWFDVTSDTTTPSPNIDVYLRTGIVVTNVSSPTSGRIGYSNVATNGIVNINLNPYGQGANTGGFEINPATTAAIQVDQFGRIIQAGALDQIRYSALITTATAGQTVFTFSNAQPDQILVFRNGCFLVPGDDYTRTSTDFTLTDACAEDDVIQAYYIRLIDADTSADKVPFVVSTQTLSYGQSSILSTYPDASELLFINGTLIVDADYTYLGGNSGYMLSVPSTGGTCAVVSFAFSNGGVLIFEENFSTTNYSSTSLVFPTQFYRNSSLIWFNGMLLKPTSDYTIPGSGSLSYVYTSIGFLNIANQPTQFCSFNSAGDASTFGLGAAGVLGCDIPIEIQKNKTILEMFTEMQNEIDALKAKVERIVK